MMCIEAGGHHNQFRLILKSNGHKEAPKDICEIRIAFMGLQRDIYRKPFSTAPPCLVKVARTREKWEPVGRKKES